MKKAPRPQAAGEGPIRMCAICRRRFAKALLARHVLDGDGNFIQDVSMRMPGRGWYRCHDPRCVAGFVKFKPKKKYAQKRMAAGM